jgi:hypothetical protein
MRAGMCARMFHSNSIKQLISCSSGAVGEIRLLRDIFDAFLATDNLQVFANAALDCIFCLLNHVKGSGKTCTAAPILIYLALI